MTKGACRRSSSQSNAFPKQELPWLWLRCPWTARSALMNKPLMVKPLPCRKAPAPSMNPVLGATWFPSAMSLVLLLQCRGALSQGLCWDFGLRTRQRTLRERKRLERLRFKVWFHYPVVELNTMSCSVCTSVSLSVRWEHLFLGCCDDWVKRLTVLAIVFSA